MTPSTVPRCSPALPSAGVLLDNSVLVRLHKCEALDTLKGTVRLVASGQVVREFRKQGPAERAALQDLGIERRLVVPGTREWEHFTALRGPEFSTRDLGEDESIAIARAAAEKGERLPFVTYDRHATRDANEAGVVTLDFLDTLAWLVGCQRLTVDDADDIEQRARRVDGWSPSAGYGGTIEGVQEERQLAVVARVARWQATR